MAPEATASRLDLGGAHLRLMSRAKGNPDMAFDLIPGGDAGSEGVRSFDFDGHSIRVVMLPGDSTSGIFENGPEPWFVAIDVCRALGLTGVAGLHTRHLQRGDVMVLAKKAAADLIASEAINSLFPRTGRPSVSLISEPGLYDLIQRSEKPTARAFKHYVSHVILPNIRKHGGYTLGQDRRKAALEKAPAAVQEATNAAHRAEAGGRAGGGDEFPLCPAQG
ncbi:MAG: BRO family protein [Amaricoccus sp.]|uniref:BRO-N domain-containing protein n=1 Tax=Amaricoccus sp. TaxID=1872485 RepID=UPI0039E25636